MVAIEDPKVTAVLTRLHAYAAGDAERWQARQRELALSNAPADPDPIVRLGEIAMAFSQEEGGLLHVLALARQAKHIVEFGASFGVSTLYLAAAARRLGGQVTTTEVHPQKCAALKKNIAEAGLQGHVTVLEGDARETLLGVASGVELVVLDGWKGMYLPVLNLLRAKLAAHALVVADNVDHQAAQDYLAHVQDPRSGFVTERVGQLALSCAV